MRLNISNLSQQHRSHGSRRIRVQRKAAPVRPSHATQLSYQKALKQVTAQLKQRMEEDILPLVKTERRLAGLSYDSPSKVPTEIDKMIDRMRADFDGAMKLYASKTATKFVAQSLQEVDKRLAKSIKASVGVDITGILVADPEITRQIGLAITTNVSLIESIPQQYMDKVETLIQENFLSGMRWETLADKLLNLGTEVDNRAALIARDQTAKLNGVFNKVRQTSLGIEKYEWQTSGDERVRDTHAENDGKIFSWDDPPEETGNPGEDINCRCVAIPVFDLE